MPSVTMVGFSVFDVLDILSVADSLTVEQASTALL